MFCQALVSILLGQPIFMVLWVTVVDTTTGGALGINDGKLVELIAVSVGTFDGCSDGKRELTMMVQTQVYNEMTVNGMVLDFNKLTALINAFL